MGFMIDDEKARLDLQSYLAGIEMKEARDGKRLAAILQSYLAGIEIKG